MEASMEAAETIGQVLAAVVELDIDGVALQVERALRAGAEARAVLNEGLGAGMRAVGERFERGEYFLIDLVLAGEVMKAALVPLEPLLATADAHASGTVVLATVQGDIHEIGKSLVATMLSAAGFQVHDLGVDVPAPEFVKRVQETGANVVGLSALLTTTMLNQEAVLEALEEAGLREQVKVVIGGAPTSTDWAQTIGADAYAENANEAVGVVRELLGV
jgi:dimethylamine corrinoid protein